jgi:hypothetical protein
MIMGSVIWRRGSRDYPFSSRSRWTAVLLTIYYVRKIHCNFYARQLPNPSVGPGPNCISGFQFQFFIPDLNSYIQRDIIIISLPSLLSLSP